MSAFFVLIEVATVLGWSRAIFSSTLILLGLGISWHSELRPVTYVQWHSPYLLLRSGIGASHPILRENFQSVTGRLEPSRSKLSAIRLTSLTGERRPLGLD